MERAYRFLSLTCPDCEKFVWLLPKEKYVMPYPEASSVWFCIDFGEIHSLMFLCCRYVYRPACIEITVNEITDQLTKERSNSVEQSPV